MSGIGDYLESVFSLEGKAVMLTGAAGGIGAALAWGFARAGGALLLCDVAEEGLFALREGIARDAPAPPRAYRMDVADLASVREAVAAAERDAGRIDVLVNCAGVNRREGFLDVDEAGYDRIMGVNLKGLYFTSQEVAKRMRLAKRGNVVPCPLRRWARARPS